MLFRRAKRIYAHIKIAAYIDFSIMHIQLS